MNYNFRKNKKGNLLDLFYTLPIVVLCVYLLVFGGAKVINSFTTFYGNVETNPTLSAQQSLQNTNTIKSFNYIPIVLLGFGIIGVIFLASYLQVSPLMMFLFIILFGFVAGYLFVYSNVMSMSVTDADFATEKTQMPQAANLPDIFPLVLIGAGVLLMVVLYARSGISGST